MSSDDADQARLGSAVVADTFEFGALNFGGGTENLIAETRSARLRVCCLVRTLSVGGVCLCSVDFGCDLSSFEDD